MTEDEVRRERVQEFKDRFQRELALRPEVSDEEFLAETEVSDEMYERGLGLAFSGGDTHSGEAS